MDQQVSIRLKDGTEVYHTSGVLAPGYYIQEISLNKELPPGEYDAVVTFEGYKRGTSIKVGALAGEVTDQNNVPVPNAVVIYKADDGTVTETTTNNDGTFIIDVPRGVGGDLIISYKDYTTTVHVDAGEASTSFIIGVIQIPGLDIVALNKEQASKTGDAVSLFILALLFVIIGSSLVIRRSKKKAKNF